MAHKEELFDVRGAKIQLFTGGEGEPLLYLHSFAGESEWLPFFEELGRHATVYAPAHPGFGASQGWERTDNVDDHVFHYVDVLDTLGIERAVVVGLSLGGWIAAEMAVHQGRHVSKLVLINSVGLRVDGAKVPDIFTMNPDAIRQIAFAEPESEIARRFLPAIPAPEKLDDAIRARQATARLGWNPYLHDPKLAGRLYRVKVPTLIVRGAEDRLVPAEHASAFAQGIADSKVVTVAGAGHLAPLEKPSETAAAILKFLRS